MLYKDLDQGSNMRTIGLVGVFFIVMAFVLGGYTTQYFLAQKGVLGTQDVTTQKDQQLQQDTTKTEEVPVQDVVVKESDPVKVSDPVPTVKNETTQQKVNPIKQVVPSPTQTPVSNPPSLESQEIMDASGDQEVNVSNSLTEIVIKNENNALVITTGSDDTELVKVPTTSVGGVPVEDTTAQNLTSQNIASPNQGSQETYEVKTVSRTSLNNNDGGGAGVGGNEFAQTSDNPIQKVQTAIENTLAGKDASNATTPPTSAIRINYTSDKVNPNIDKWLADYQFQVWPLGEDKIAIHRNGITTVTPYSIRLGLSKLSFKVDTGKDIITVPYYFDSVWTYLGDLRLISPDTHDEPIELVVENDELVYRIKAESKQLMFAILPSKVCMEVVVSAQTRDIKDSKTCGPWDTVKDLLSLTI